MINTRVTEIAEGIFRLSNVVRSDVSPDGFTFNQFLVLGDEPFMFHAGLRKMFPGNREALASIVPLESLRWIAFGHFEADECGSMNEWLAVAPMASPAHGEIGCRVSLGDFATRPPRVLSDGAVIDLGMGKRVRFVDTPHTPHGWDAAVVFEESTRTLLCGDLFTQFGESPLSEGRDIVGPAIQAEDILAYSALSPGMGTTIRNLAKLKPRTLGLMHGPAFEGDGAQMLKDLGDDYDRRTRAALHLLDSPSPNDG